jgi:hypothetical protein
MTGKQMTVLDAENTEAGFEMAESDGEKGEEEEEQDGTERRRRRRRRRSHAQADVPCAVLAVVR